MHPAFQHILPDVEVLFDRVAIVLEGRLRRIATVRELVSGHAQRVEIRCAGRPVVEIPSALVPVLERHDQPHETVFALSDDRWLHEALRWLLAHDVALHAVTPQRRHARGAVPRHRRGPVHGRRPDRGAAVTEERVIPVLIARNTFREASRDRLMVGLAVAGLAAMGATQVLAPLALGEGVRLTVDLGRLNARQKIVVLVFDIDV